MTTDRPEYRPADRAWPTFAMTDEHGKPAPGAIIGAVDEAGFGVLDSRPGLEPTHLHLRAGSGPSGSSRSRTGRRTRPRPLPLVRDASPAERLRARTGARLLENLQAIDHEVAGRRP